MEAWLVCVQRGAMRATVGAPLNGDVDGQVLPRWRNDRNRTAPAIEGGSKERRIINAGSSGIRRRRWQSGSIPGRTAHGSVRAAATIRAQSPRAREAIRAALREIVMAYKRGDHFELPMPAVVATAVKS
jgi:hypothetical protein